MMLFFDEFKSLLSQNSEKCSYKKICTNFSEIMSYLKILKTTPCHSLETSNSQKSRPLSLFQLNSVSCLRRWAILTFISYIDGIVIGLSTLLMNLRTVGPFRRNAHHDLLDIVAFLQDQLNRQGMLHGYKIMHLKCILF